MDTSKQLWKYSVPVELGSSRPDRCFTTLPIRIHKDSDLFDKASYRLRREWSQIFGYDETLPASNPSPAGNECALILVECLPDHVELLAYFGEFAFAYDGKSDKRLVL